LLYDNIYQERYMGLPQEDKESFIKGSPITYAKISGEIYWSFMVRVMITYTTRERNN
jgi:hypothetical protein